MATKTLLPAEALEEARTVLLPPVVPPVGGLFEGQAFPAADFSSWLAIKVEELLRQYENWVPAHPIAIGSWGLGELTPKSDLDVVFCGEEKVVSELTQQMEKDGWPLRYRYSRDPQDWSKEANIFELNALFWARPFSQQGAEALQDQKRLILKAKKTFRQKLLREFGKERKKRNKRLDSITNYLEPNIKFGPGGLRDMQQALMIWFWFGERLGHHPEVSTTLNHLKSFILTVRQRLHLTGYGDILVAQAQYELAKWFGYKSQKEFMRELQIALARISFYSDWVFELAAQKEVKKLRALKKPEEAFRLLKKDASLEVQEFLLNQTEAMPDFSYNKKFKSIFNVEVSDHTLRALYRSQILQKVVPDFVKIMGVVQHDQYHRYTVGTHLLQAMRRVCDVYRSRSKLGKLKAFTVNFTKKDWEILLWSALYHDLGKDRKQDHSVVGKELVEKDLPRFGWSKSFCEEVAWIVENHLALSTAAFRKDPHSPHLWAELFDRGITGLRLRRLALFTAIDIHATNPEAWSPWKEKLLFDLVKSVEAPRANQFLKVKAAAKKLDLPIGTDIIENMDVGFLTSVSPHALVKDVSKVMGEERDEIFVVKHPQSGFWVRFHHPKDEDGLFLRYVSRLWSSGLPIRHAYIHTLPDVGVYDWFHVKSKLTEAQVKKRLEHSQEGVLPKEQDVRFDEVALVSESKNEWVFSFRGTNQKGVLAVAAQILYEVGLPIRWAKVHTWGRQIDDTFGVQIPDGELVESWTRKLKNRLVDK